MKPGMEKAKKASNHSVVHRLELSKNQPIGVLVLLFSAFTESHSRYVTV